MDHPPHHGNGANRRSPAFAQEGTPYFGHVNARLARSLKGGQMVISLTVLVLTVLSVFLHASEYEMTLYFASDTLYLPSIFEDVIEHGQPFSQWSLNPAPNFFPDMGAFFVLRWLLGDLVLASYAFSVIQCVVIVLLFRGVMKAAGLNVEHGAIGLAALFLAMEVGTGSWGGNFYYSVNMLFNSFHTGSFVNAMGATVLLLGLFSGGRVWRTVLFAVWVLLSGLSDKLFFILFCAPAAVACLAISFHPRYRSAALRALVVIVAFSVLSIYATQAITSFFGIVFEAPYAFMSFDRISFCWQQAVHVVRVDLLPVPVTATIVCMTLLVMLVMLVQGFRTIASIVRRSDGAGFNVRQAALRIMLCVFFPGVLLAPVLNGSFDGYDSIRYNLAPFMLGPMIVGMWAGSRSGRSAHWTWAFSTLVLGTLTMQELVHHRGKWMDRLAYIPEKVVRMDKLVEAHGLQRGVGDYWEAKRFSMFTRTGRTVLPVYENLTFMEHVNRTEMFLVTSANDPTPPSFDFVLVKERSDSAEVSRILKRPCTMYNEEDVWIAVTTPWRFDPATHRPEGAEQ